MREREITKLIVDNYSDEFERCLVFLCRFLSLHKNSSCSISLLRERLLAQNNEFEVHRAEIFLEIYEYVATLYAAYLDENMEYDFADMINAAAQAVCEIPECARGYRYILLDEVQDLSPNRQDLVRAILDKNPKCRLFAVGDDWQSIYRFAGSDPMLISNFSHFFSRHTRKSLIETTHRFGKTTAKISSRFVQKNPYQASKKVRSARGADTPINIVLSSRDGNDSDAFERIIEHLIAKYGEQGLQEKRLQIISRYNRDIGRLRSDDFLCQDNNDGTFSVIWRQ